MRPEDIVVEVRDVNMVRHGQIEDDLVNIRATLRYLSVGEWRLVLPADHPLSVVLRQPGAGIVVTHRDPAIGVLFSGPKKIPRNEATPTDPVGTTEFEGVTDNVILWNRNTRPTPKNAIGSQGDAYDVRSGSAEGVMRGYVNDNIGPGATLDRWVTSLTLAPDGGRGGTTKRSTRFDVLGDLLAEIAAGAGLGFEVIQSDANLLYRPLVPVDRRKLVRLDITNGTLSSTTSETTGFDQTHVVVAGQGVGGARTLIERSTPASRAWAEAWGPWGRIETFKDQRQTDDLLELQQAGDELLEEGAARLAVKAVASDDQTMEYGKHWGLGDFLTVVIDGVEGSVQATSAELVVSRERTGLSLGIGEVVGWNPAAQTAKRLDATDARLANLERNAETASTWPASAITSGEFAAARIPVALRGVDLPEGTYVKAGGVRNELGGNLTGRLAFYGASIRLEQSPWDSGSSNRAATLRVNATGQIDHNVDGGSYNPFPHAEAAGVVDMTMAGGTTITTTVTFPVNRFDVPPIVETSRNNAAAGRMMPYATNITRTGCTIGAISSDGSSPTGLVRVGWTAKQMTPTSATG